MGRNLRWNNFSPRLPGKHIINDKANDKSMYIFAFIQSALIVKGAGLKLRRLDKPASWLLYFADPSGYRTHLQTFLPADSSCG